MLGDQLRAYALASARTLTPTGEVGDPRGTVSISSPVVMVLPMAGIIRSTSQKAHYVNWAEYQRRALNVGNQGPLRRRLAFSPRTSRRSAPPDPPGPAAGQLVPAPTLPALFSGR